MTNVLPDAYTVRARVQPAVLVVLPALLAATTWLGSEWHALVPAVVVAALAGFGAQLARSAGKKNEESLFSRWGGKPTVQKLRHRDSRNHTALLRLHTMLETAIPDIKIPTAEEELADPSAADDIYEVCADYLRTRFREQRLVLEENCNYGFRRNLWGLKPVGLVFGAVALIAVWLPPSLGVMPWTPMVVGIGALVAVQTALWIWCVNPTWVRVAADAYAERLVEEAAMLGTGEHS